MVFRPQVIYILCLVSVQLEWFLCVLCLDIICEVMSGNHDQMKAPERPERPVIDCVRIPVLTPKPPILVYSFFKFLSFSITNRAIEGFPVTFDYRQR